MAHKPHELEYTKLLQSGAVFHYTCNAPSSDMLSRHGVQELGQDVDSDPRGLLLIPADVYTKFGLVLDPLNDSETHRIVSENLMRKMSEREKSSDSD
ncbi:MAG: hypothetical protein KKH88_01865 [Nanoarchaeota archaeon]|nr:hypothetical protein [Nanoarchaeota archaeon]MBU1445299.1 hypothetical protein [Nanoarchaeota archaeon]MBU2406804.1 hypothetical protein [Nanoarchaeota archaeon]MBU2420495.1 hypothetical protein [Nanoarchaeota archaeon]MBU2475080.1 hypothetical protein [Nanoarchaeota archaeon]